MLFLSTWIYDVFCATLGHTYFSTLCLLLLELSHRAFEEALSGCSSASDAFLGFPSNSGTFGEERSGKIFVIPFHSTPFPLPLLSWAGEWRENRANNTYFSVLTDEHKVIHSFLPRRRRPTFTTKEAPP